MEKHCEGSSLYTEVTARIVAELEAGRLPWVQPWDSAACTCTLPCNASTGRRYSGINILLLWGAVIERGYAGHRWLTFKQAQALGGSVRRGEKGTVVCYADRFTPKAEAERSGSEEREARTVAFLKRFTVFNVNQCNGLPEELTRPTAALPERETIPQAEAFARTVAPTHVAPSGEIAPAELAKLEAAVRSLRRLDREIFLAHRLDAMSYADIAKVTGLSVRQVEKAMVRALCGIGRHLRGEPPRRRRWWPF